MLEQVLAYLNNWFVMSINNGTYTITDGSITLSFLQEGQYYRIFGSVFNDGLHQYGKDELTDETFDGTIWALAIPNTIINIVKDIEAWQDKYGDAAASPFTSESFGGYSYSKGNTSSSSAAETTWQTKFAARLAPYRKLKEMAAVEGTGYQDPSYRRPFNPEFPWGMN